MSGAPAPPGGDLADELEEPLGRALREAIEAAEALAALPPEEALREAEDALTPAIARLRRAAGEV